MQQSLRCKRNSWRIRNIQILSWSGSWRKKLNAEYIVQTSVEQLIRISSHQQNNPIQGKEERCQRRGNSCRIRICPEAGRIVCWQMSRLSWLREIYIQVKRFSSIRQRYWGFVTMYGTINSHTAVLTRTKVNSGGHRSWRISERRIWRKDNYYRWLWRKDLYWAWLCNSNEDAERKDANLRHVRNRKRLKGKENITQSGRDICANVGTREDIENVLRSDAGGIGLFRSEFLYMEMGSKLPSRRAALSSL